MELIDKAEVLAAIENAAKSNPLYVTIAEKYAFKDGVNDALESVLKLEVKEVQKEPASVWRDAKHQPKIFRKYLVRYSDGRVSGSWERHDDDFIPWKDVVKEHGFTHWCYVEDLLKL